LTVGGRQHIDKGNPSEVDAELWTTLLDDRVAYDPAEMLCVVEAGMRIHDLRTILAEGAQEWPVDAPDDATVGGVVATGGPTVRQLRVGTMRDTVVEMEVVTGDGRLIKSGARTVKNVTGYDVHRLLTGSLGTLGVIVQVALKVRPLPKATRTAGDRGGRRGARGTSAGRRPASGHRARGARPSRRSAGRVAGRGRRADRRRPVDHDLRRDRRSVPEARFPEARTVAEAAVVPSRLRPLLAGIERYRAMIGVGIAWVPFEDDEALTAFRGTGRRARRDRARDPRPGRARRRRGSGGRGAAAGPYGDGPPPGSSLPAGRGRPRTNPGTRAAG
jgi:FAD/FMN-containing dehydrogenase